MIHLKPLENSESVAAYFAQCGLPFTAHSGCLTAVAGEEVLGFSLYEADKYMTVLRLSPENDLMLADGILRSTLHVAVDRGLTDAFYDPSIADLCHRLDFVENEAENRLNIGKLFQSCHGCRENT